MASGGSDPPHGKTEVKMKFTAADFGPFCVMEGNHDRNFIGGGYLLTTPKDLLVLYRRYGGTAQEDGQYWTTDRRGGNWGYRLDYAVENQWNSLQKETYLLVPKGVYVYEGMAARQSCSGSDGGGWQVFIPQSVVEPLRPLTTLLLSKSSTLEQKQKAWDTVQKAQLEILNRWNKKRIERITSNPQQLAIGGRKFRTLPPALQRAIRSAGNGNSSSTKEVIPKGTYKVYEERIQHINGGYQTLSLSVKTEFVKSTTRTYKSGKTIIVETTNYYNIIYIWS